MKFIFPLFFLFFSINNIAADAIVKKDSISVYIFLLEDCVISQYYSLPLRNLYEEFASDEVHFIGIFPNRFSSPESIANFKETYNIPFELKYDYYQILSKKMDAKVTPEVVVYDHLKEKTIYKGRIDNSFFRLGKRRQITTSSELKDVLQAIKDGEIVETAVTDAVGCFIKYEKN